MHAAFTVTINTSVNVEMDIKITYISIVYKYEHCEYQVLSPRSVSYTHLTLPTICSV